MKYKKKTKKSFYSDNGKESGGKTNQVERGRKKKVGRERNK
jgi:hypothetical protein